MSKGVSCWEEGPYYFDRGCGSTCLLPDGHDGDHEFTPDDEIAIVFREAAQ